MASVSSTQTPVGLESPCPKLSRLTRTRIPTEFGEFQLLLYRDEQGRDHLVFYLGELASARLVRVHSECFTGDVLGSLRCDCGPQLRLALQKIAQAGQGIVIYLRQEGRGIGLLDKLRAYNLQDLGFDTVEANLQLGHPPDAREYSVAAAILRDLGVGEIELLTNNPRKVEGLQQLGIRVRQRVPLQVPVSAEGRVYLEAKRRRLNHLLPEDWPGLQVWPENWHGRLAALARMAPADRPLITLCSCSAPRYHALGHWHQALLTEQDGRVAAVAPDGGTEFVSCNRDPRGRWELSPFLRTLRSTGVQALLVRMDSSLYSSLRRRRWLDFGVFSGPRVGPGNLPRGLTVASMVLEKEPSESVLWACWSNPLTRGFVFP